MFTSRDEGVCVASSRKGRFSHCSKKAFGWGGSHFINIRALTKNSSNERFFAKLPSSSAAWATPGGGFLAQSSLGPAPGSGLVSSFPLSPPWPPLVCSLLWHWLLYKRNDIAGTGNSAADKMHQAKATHLKCSAIGSEFVWFLACPPWETWRQCSSSSFFQAFLPYSQAPRSSPLLLRWTDALATIPPL